MALLVDDTAAAPVEAPPRRRDWRSLLDPRYMHARGGLARGGLLRPGAGRHDALQQPAHELPRDRAGDLDVAQLHRHLHQRRLRHAGAQLVRLRRRHRDHLHGGRLRAGLAGGQDQHPGQGLRPGRRAGPADRAGHPQHGRLEPAAVPAARHRQRRAAAPRAARVQRVLPARHDLRAVHARGAGGLPDGRRRVRLDGLVAGGGVAGLRRLAMDHVPRDHAADGPAGDALGRRC